MKKGFLFVVMLLSISTFSQDNLHEQKNQILASGFSSDEWIQKSSQSTAGIRTKFDSSSVYISQTANHRSLVQKIDSNYTWLWDPQNNTGWNTGYKCINFLYDDAYNVLSRTKQRWYAGAWINAAQEISTYNENNKLSSFTYISWTDNAWENFQGYEYLYDESGNMTSELFKSWNNNAWENYSRYLFTYDANNNKTSETFQGTNNANWWNINTIDYTYDSANNLLSELQQTWAENVGTNNRLVTNTYNTSNNILTSVSQNWDGTDWQFDFQNIYTYDSTHNLISKLTQNQMEGQWIDSDQYIYTYDDNNNRIIELHQGWYENAWLNITLHNRTFDASLNLTRNLYQGWFGNEWVNYWLTRQSFDENNFKQSQSMLFWDGTGNTITHGDSLINYYQPVQVKTESMAWNEQLAVFPNPGNGKFSVSTQSPIEAVEIRSISGEMVYADYHVNQGPTIEINLSNLPKGIYILKAIAGNKTYNRKIIIQ